MTDLKLVEEWARAKEVADVVGRVPPFFSNTIRSLVKDEQENGGERSRSTNEYLKTLFNSASVKAPIYHATLSFHPEALEGKAHVSRKDLIAPYSPKDLASVISLLYVYKQLSKKAPELQWNELKDEIARSTEIGGYYGQSVPNVGFFAGLLCGGMRLLGLGALLCFDAYSFDQYQRYRKENNMGFDLAYETDLFGCNHVNVSAIFVQTVGLGLDLAKDFATGLETNYENLLSLPDNQSCFAAAPLWIQSLLLTGAEPNVKHVGDFYPLAEKRTLLLELVQSVNDTGKMDHWLSRTAEDAHPDNAPVLYNEKERERFFAAMERRKRLDKQKEEEEQEIRESAQFDVQEILEGGEHGEEDDSPDEDSSQPAD